MHLHINNVRIMYGEKFRGLNLFRFYLDSEKFSLPAC